LLREGERGLTYERARERGGYNKYYHRIYFIPWEGSFEVLNHKFIFLLEVVVQVALSLTNKDA